MSNCELIVSSKSYPTDRLLCYVLYTQLIVGHPNSFKWWTSILGFGTFISTSSGTYLQVIALSLMHYDVTWNFGDTFVNLLHNLTWGEYCFGICFWFVLRLSYQVLNFLPIKCDTRRNMTFRYSSIAALLIKHCTI